MLDWLFHQINQIINMHAHNLYDFKFGMRLGYVVLINIIMLYAQVSQTLVDEGDTVIK